MRRTLAQVVTIPALVVAAASLASEPEAPRMTYRFDEVKSKVLVASAATPKAEKRVLAGETAASGDHVRTGFWARAVVSVPERKTRFEIASDTHAVLAGVEPGVLLTLEKGRLKAIFDAFTDGPPQERRVSAPGALLSVRGTRYGLEVGEGGQTLLAVFEGVVEVTPRIAGLPPVLVRAEELCTFGPKAPPRPAPMRDRGLNEGNWDRRPMSGGAGDRDGAGPGGATRGMPGPGSSPGMPSPGGSPPSGMPGHGRPPR